MLGLLPPEEIADAAVLALEDGCDTPSLRVLAGLTAAEADEASALLDRALAEFNPSFDQQARRGDALGVGDCQRNPQRLYSSL